MPRRLKYWGWGHEEQGLSPHDRENLLSRLAGEFDIHGAAGAGAPPIAELDLPRPRLDPPASLAARCTQEPYERILHSFGQSQPDSIRIFAGDFAHAPDVVAYPRDEAEVVAVLEWAGEAGAALIPFGGGSSVVGGVTPDLDDGFAGTVMLDMSRMNRGARGGPGVPGRLDPGRSARPGTGGRAEASRDDVAALPPVLPTLHPGRLDRHSLGWAFRHSLHPHRRLGRERFP